MRNGLVLWKGMLGRIMAAWRQCFEESLGGAGKWSAQLVGRKTHSVASLAVEQKLHRSWAYKQARYSFQPPSK